MSTELNSSQPVAQVIVALDIANLILHSSDCGKMAERSKACDSSESLPALAGFSSGYPGVGSNPTLVTFCTYIEWRIAPPHVAALNNIEVVMTCAEEVSDVSCGRFDS